MPSTYAHYRFGKQVYSHLPEAIQDRIAPYIDLFYIGLHGPDILFYYHPIGKNPVSEQGYAMHGIPAKHFFSKAKVRIRSSKNPDEQLSYILGFICHFALDRYCHPYVEKFVRETGISHTEVEVEFDRILLEKDGKDAVSTKLSNHIKYTRKIATVIAPFFTNVSPKLVKVALHSLVVCTNLLVAPKGIKRFFVLSAFRLSGHYDSLRPQVMNLIANPACKRSNKELLLRYRDARKMAQDLIIEYVRDLEKTAILNPIYEHTFGEE